MKRFLCILGVLIISLSSIDLSKAFAIETSTIQNVHGISFTQQNVDNLLSLGFTEDEIINMNVEEWQLNKNLTGEVVSSDTTYVKMTYVPQEGINALSTSGEYYKSYSEEISEEEFNSVKEGNSDIGLLTTPSTKTAYKSMTTTIIRLSSKQFRVKNSVVWLKMPANRKIDVLGIAVNSADWYPDGGEYGKQSWRLSDGSYGEANYSSSSSMWQRSTSGYALKNNLKDDEWNGITHKWVTNLSHYMYFTVEARNSPTRIDAYGHFAHQETQYQLTPSISFPGGGSVTVSPSDAFTYHPNTQATIKNITYY